MTSRHGLPRFDLSLGHSLHGLGRFVVAHPVSSAALILLPFCVAVLIVTCRDLRRRGGVRWHGIRPGWLARRQGLVGDRLGPAHSG